MVQFLLHLPVTLVAARIKAALLESRQDAASGFRVVTAVRKPAAGPKFADVCERGRQRFFIPPQPNLTKSGGVDDRPTTWKDEQFASYRRVPTARVVLPDRKDLLLVAPEKPVHDRRLPHARRTQ